MFEGSKTVGGVDARHAAAGGIPGNSLVEIDVIATL